MCINGISTLLLSSVEVEQLLLGPDGSVCFLQLASPRFSSPDGTRCVHVLCDCNTLHGTTTHYNTLQHTTAHCNSLHRTATCLQHTTKHMYNPTSPTNYYRHTNLKPYNPTDIQHYIPTNLPYNSYPTLQTLPYPTPTNLPPLHTTHPYAMKMSNRLWSCSKLWASWREEYIAPPKTCNTGRLPKQQSVHCKAL